MLRYNTGINASPPITPAMQQQALAGLQSQGQMRYPGPAQDVYNARAQEAAVDMERWAAAQNNEHLMRAQQAQTDTALKGLGQMAQAQQNANNLANQQYSTRLNYAGQLMGGLNGMLSGLFS